MVIDAIDCLVKTKRKKSIPKWVYILDYSLAILYLATFVAVFVLMIRYFVNG